MAPTYLKNCHLKILPTDLFEIFKKLFKHFNISVEMSLENLANRCFRFSSDNSTDVFKTFKHICRIVARKPCQKIFQISLTISGKHWPSQDSTGPEFWLSTKIRIFGLCACEILFIFDFIYLNFLSLTFKFFYL